MEFNYTVWPDIPCLAWSLRVNTREAKVVHGSLLETQPSFFTDGVWAGEFSKGGFGEGFFCGTGAILDQRGVTLVSSDTPIDRVFTTRIGRELFASNSLPFFLALIDDSLDDDGLFYRSLFTSTGISVRRAPRAFRTKAGRTVRWLSCENALVNTSGEITPALRPLDRDFRDYQDYRTVLARTVAAVAANARSGERTMRYEPVVALSAGYDSPAVAVLMKEAAGGRAVTMLRYSENHELVDYPGPVAAKLGIDLQGFERDGWRDSAEFPDAEIAATGTGFVDIPLLAIEPALPGSLLFTGYVGTLVWNRENFKCYRDITRKGDTCGQGLAEYRLRVGFTVFPVPIIGSTAHPSLYRIANSPEMQPWSVGGHYDSPIARRMVEEAGVDRDAFATRKYAGGAVIYSNAFKYQTTGATEMLKDMSRFMTKHGAASFVAYCVDGRAARHRTRRLAVNAGHWIFWKMTAVDYRVGCRLHRLGIKGLVPLRLRTLLASRLMLRADYTYLLPHWGTGLLKTRYQRAMQNFAIRSSQQDSK